MTKYFILFFFAVLLMEGQAQSSRHVILISVDGLRPTFYQDSSWPAPNLQGLARQGAFATTLRSVFPSYTYPAHAAMLTGAMPARSGIYYNVPFEPMGGSGQWNWHLSAVKAPTLWQALRRHGLTTAAVQWPVSVGDQIDFNIPEIWSPAHPSDRITLSRQNATKGLVEEVEENATGKLTADNMDEHYMMLDDNAGRIAAYIFTKYRPNFLALHFAGVDGVQHIHGTSAYPVRIAVAAVDRAIGHVLETVKKSGAADSTTLLIVGDHGFADYDTVLKPNIWLSQHGMLGQGKQWRVRFQPAGGSAFLYLQNRNDTSTFRQVQQLLAALPADQKRRFILIHRSRLDSMGVDSSAILALSAKPGTVFSGSTTGASITAAHGGHHGYDPALSEMLTGIIGTGAGLLKGGNPSGLQVCDVAPIIAAVLGIPFEAPDGTLKRGVIDTRPNIRMAR